MISVKEAKKLVSENVAVGSIATVSLLEAIDCSLGENVFAPVSIPLFNQSAMDGYAFRYEDSFTDLIVIDEIPAGDHRLISVKKGEAVRIFTGSKVPDDCDTVVMQELVKVEDKTIKILDKNLKIGKNIRKQGGQFTKGDLVLKQKMKITPATIGLIASMGIDQVKVVKTPKVSIIATGNELVKPGDKIKSGQIYESNTYMITAALNKMNIKPSVVIVKDDKDNTQEAIELALLQNDLVILSGGISVGDYDFVKEALEKNGVERIFYKVKQKPGKPLYFGKTTSTYVFALPGNPAAALTCFYEYVSIAIRLLGGEENYDLTKLNLPSNTTYHKKKGRAEFLKGITNLKTVTILEGQGSDVLQSFSKANCLIYMSEEEEIIDKGAILQVHLLP